MQSTSWAAGLELVGDDDRLVGFAGALPLRLLAERTGLWAGLSAAMAQRGFDPVYDRGQVLIDLALTQILGGAAISDFQGLRHLRPVTGRCHRPRRCGGRCPRSGSCSSLGSTRR
ncbi:MAG: hypothetical protein H0U62_08645 [Actinobacteria bacterium]|nr:hypothetical protein [Actinomycetota bacterium]